MNFWIFIIPLITAFFGWLTHKIAVAYILNKHWPKIQSQLSRSAGELVASHFSLDQIEQKIADPITLEKAMPSIETYIDTFLNEKLQHEIPMLSMFVGTKTTDKIKSIFIDQLKQLFPTVMAQITSNLKENFNFTSLIIEKINHPDVQERMQNHLRAELKYLPVLGLVSGFITGLISALIFYFIK